MIIIRQCDPHDPEATALLKASHALMESLFPAEANNYLAIDQLCVPEITFLSAEKDGAKLGCGALCNKGTYGEIKSMFVAEAARGKGIAQALLRALEDEAIAQKLPELKLETGTKLHSAHRLYEAFGFTKCAPFGDYEGGEFNVFMEKSLAR